MNGRSIIRTGYLAVVLLMVTTLMAPATLAAHELPAKPQGGGLMGEDSQISTQIESDIGPAYLVKDINPGGNANIENLIDNNGTLYFNADDGVHGPELWKSDGTVGGTEMVKDIDPLGGSDPKYLTMVNDTLFFQADYVLWKSDGSQSGTVKVKDVNIGSLGWLTDVNGTLFFAANEELWMSNGTEVGTVMVKDINPSGSSYPKFLTNVNGTLFFVADDGVNGEELWKSDGTEAGTVMVKDINPSGYSHPMRLIDVHGTLFFTAYDGHNNHGTELWKSNGTEAGTVMVKDIYPGVVGSDPWNLIDVEGTLYFVGYDFPHGQELWKSDGSESGTVIVKDIIPGNAGALDSLCNDRIMTSVNNIVYFITGDGCQLWKSNGSESGTEMVLDIPSCGTFSCDLTYPTDGNGKLLFNKRNEGQGNELWTLDCSETGNVMVQDIAQGENSSSPLNLMNSDELIYFTADDGVNGRELWALPFMPDIYVEKNTNMDPAMLGADLTYTLSVMNCGNAIATTVELTDLLPSTVDFSSVSPEPPTCVNENSTLSCNLDDLDPQELEIVSIVISPKVLGLITNSASVTILETEFDLSNNTDEIITKVLAPIYLPIIQELH